MKNFIKLIVVIFSVAILFANHVSAHARTEKTVPRAGEILDSLPAEVIVYFDSEIEPKFSKLRVVDSQNQQVSKGISSDENDTKVLRTTILSSGSGTYHVYWNVVARDGHRTKGDYVFTVR